VHEDDGDVPYNATTTAAAATDDGQNKAARQVQQPIFGSVDAWCEASGLGRSATYEAISAGWLPSVKIGKRRLIDMERGIAAMRAMCQRTQSEN